MFLNESEVPIPLGYGKTLECYACSLQCLACPKAWGEERGSVKQVDEIKLIYIHKGLFMSSGLDKSLDN